MNNLKTPTKFFLLKSKCVSQRQYGDRNLWKTSNPSFVYTQVALPKSESFALGMYHPLVYLVRTICSTKVLSEIEKVILVCCLGILVMDELRKQRDSS